MSSAKAKKGKKERDEKKEPINEDVADEEALPWKNVFRPTCAQAPKDNSFTLDDESLSSAVEGLLSCLTVSDPNEEGNPTCFVSAGFMSMMGVSEQECLGRNSNVLQAGKVDSPVAEAQRTAVAERRVVSLELNSTRKDGRSFPSLLSLVPVLGGDGGSVLHLVGLQADLEERRRRGEAADEAFVARWQEQVRHHLAAFALVDVSGGGGGAAAAAAGGGGAGAAGGPGGGRAGTAGSSSGPAPATTAVCGVSPGFTALTGYSQADVLGWNLLCLCGPDSSERDMRRLITSQWSHTPSLTKLLCYKRDGTPFWALVLSCPITPAAPQPPQQLGRGLVGGSSGRAAQAYGGLAGRAGGLGLGGLLGGLGSALGNQGGGAGAGGEGGGAGSSAVKYCLCCVVDITAQRLRRIVGGKYVLGKVIGQGAFGLVRIGKNVSTDELVAVKSVDATRFRNIAEIDQIQEEMSVLASLKHPHIIRLFDVHFQNNTFFLVMEFAGGGSLVHFMRHHGDPVRHCLDEATAGRVFVQMISALDYCHRRRVIHRDLKPENILLDDANNLKIADFGLAAVTAPFSGGLTLQCGTPEFTAPEITVGREYDGTSVDIWSMGVILYEALTGVLPFRGANQAALFKAIQKGVYEPLPASLSSECRDLVRRMLLVDPSSRAAMDDILRHPWVSRAAASPGLGAGGRLGSSSGLQGLLPSAASLPEPADDDALMTRQSSGAVGGSGPGLDGGRPSSSLWRGDRPDLNNGSGSAGTGAGSGAGHRGEGLGGDSLGPPSYASSRPTSAGLGPGGASLGPASPAGVGLSSGLSGGLSGLGLGSGLPGGSGPAGGLHDSVKLVLPSGGTDPKDDPILAAILRSHGHGTGDPNSPSRNSGADDGDDGGSDSLRVQPSAQSLAAGGAGVGRRDSTPVSAARMGAGSRSMGGMPTAAGGGLHGGGQGGKARGGALLPTLAGGGASNPALNGVLGDRRAPESSRFRSPARGPVPGGTGGMGRGGASTGRMQPQQQQQQSSPLSGQNAESNGRQLPPIQTARAASKKGNVAAR